MFETDRDLVAAPATIAALQVEEGINFAAVPTDPAPATFLPFGADAENGRALWIGIASDVRARTAARVRLRRVARRPARRRRSPTGGVVALPVPPAPLLRWELLDGGRVEPLEVAARRDRRTGRSGVVELALPRAGAPGAPPGSDGTDAALARASHRRGPVRWRRRRCSLVLLNAWRATAAATVRDEVLEPIGTDDRRSYRLSADAGAARLARSSTSTRATTSAKVWAAPAKPTAASTPEPSGARSTTCRSSAPTIASTCSTGHSASPDVRRRRARRARCRQGFRNVRGAPVPRRRRSRRRRRRRRDHGCSSAPHRS